MKTADNSSAMQYALVHPTLEDRRCCLENLKLGIQGLSHAQNLYQVALSLLELHQSVKKAAGLHGINLADLDDVRSARALRRVLARRAGKNKKILTEPLPGRAPYDTVKNAILEYAAERRTFTVDDLQRDLRLPATRRSLSANLWSLATRGDKPLVRNEPGRLGCKGTPSTYSLRRTNEGR